MPSKEDWMAELARQDNLDPVRRIPNGALFQGTLINGTQHLNKVQRIGGVILGLLSQTFGCSSVARVVTELRSRALGYDTLSLGIFGPHLAKSPGDSIAGMSHDSAAATGSICCGAVSNSRTKRSSEYFEQVR